MDIFDTPPTSFSDLAKATEYLHTLRSDFEIANLSYWHVGRPNQRFSGGATWLSTYPDGYQEVYLRRELHHEDPAFVLSFSRLLPTDWEMIHQVDSCKAVLEAAQDYQISSRGLAIPIRDEETGDSLFNVNVQCEETKWHFIRKDLARDFMLVAHVFHAMIRDLLVEKPEKPVLPKLSPREFEVIKLAAQGLTGKQIARAIGISENTVRIFMQLARKRLNARTKAEAIALVSSHGLLL